MPVGHLLQHIGADPFAEFHHPLLVAGGAEVTALAGEGQQVLVAAILSLIHISEPTRPY